MRLNKGLYSVGLFDFLKKKTDDDTLVKVTKETFPSQSNAVDTYFDGLASLDKIFKLVWFADGKFKNYDSEQDQDILFKNELFTVTFSFGTEPSLLSSKLPIKPTLFSEANQSIGYYPSYERLTPEQRWIYLNWLKDVRQDVDIGYVFIFYYGLERHLMYGNYKDAVDVILLLRKWHKNNSFQSYSLNALILASILHKDKETLEKALEKLDNEYPSNLVLIAKYLMKLDITPEEIISMASSAGFKNKGYISKYPELFKEVLSSKLKAEFGKNTYPLSGLDANFETKKLLVFANISLPSDTRSPLLPSIIDCPIFKESIMNLLGSTHQDVKEKLAQMRKDRNPLVPKISVISNSTDSNLDSICPYCNENLDKPPKKKKKCPQCGNFIYVRSSKILFPNTCLTEDEALATDEFYSIKEYGFEKEDFFEKHKLIIDEQGNNGTYVETCISIYEELLLEKTEDIQLQILYFKIALLNYKVGKEFIPYLQHAAKMQLQNLKKNGHKKVMISSIGSCEECQRLNGRVLTIEEALKEKSIPCLKCTYELEEGKPGWCRCNYTYVG